MIKASRGQKCSGCGMSTLHWAGYHCPRCGRFNPYLYGNEHAQGPKEMTEDEARKEYQLAGIPFCYQEMPTLEEVLGRMPKGVTNR